MAQAKKAVSVDVTVCTMKELTELIKYSVKSDQPIGIEGPPGIGKSAAVGQVAKELGLPMEVMILSLCDPTDIGGFPTVTNGAVERFPLGPLKRACDEPVVLFLDELTMASPPVQGAAMRLIYERWAGERKLHEGTRIVAAWNPPDQSAGGYDMALPLMGRLTKVKLHPKMDEVRQYFYGLGGLTLQTGAGEKVNGTTVEAKVTKEEAKAAIEKARDPLIRLAVDFAATTEVSADLIQIEPPAGSQVAGKQWGAPRSWERGLRLCAEMVRQNPKLENGSLFLTALAGNIGDDQAAAFIAIRKVREHLPSEEEILKDPTKARLPETKEHAIAALGLLAQVAMRDYSSAWLYAARLKQPEARVACLTTLTKVGKHDESNPRFKEGYAAMRSVFKDVAKALGIDNSLK